MPERIKITVRPSAAHPDVLTIEDAMKQVLDLFEMLETAPGVEWKLTSASTNSPLTVQAEAVSFERTVDVSVVARSQRQHFATQVSQLARGELPSDPKFKTIAAKRFLTRNLNGVGETIIEIEGIKEPISITPKIAKRAIQAIQQKTESDLYGDAVAREEIGSIEGRLSDIGTHYNVPAVKINTNYAGEVWCRLSDDLRAQFQDKAKYEDVWQHRRVIVRGRIRYRAESGIDYVLATDVRLIQERAVGVEQIADRDFTGGLSISEYLDRFRDGTLG